MKFLNTKLHSLGNSECNMVTLNIASAILRAKFHRGFDIPSAKFHRDFDILSAKIHRGFDILSAKFHRGLTYRVQNSIGVLKY